MAKLNLIDLKNESKAKTYFVENGIWEFDHFSIKRVIMNYGDAG